MRSIGGGIPFFPLTRLQATGCLHRIRIAGVLVAVGPEAVTGPFGELAACRVSPLLPDSRN